jgi:hypothetical protein
VATSPFPGHRTSASPVQDHRTAVLERPRLVRRSGLTSFAVASYLSSLQAESDPWARLQRGIALLPGLVDGCDHAGIVTVAGGRVEVRAASDAITRRADELQDALRTGPSLQAVRTGHSVVARDLGSESRWRAWCAAVHAELPVTSVLSVLLVATQRPTAALNLYSDDAAGLSGVDLGLLHTLTRPLAGALRGAHPGGDLLGPAA